VKDTSLKNIADGARVYLVPVGPVLGGRLDTLETLAVGTTGLHYTHARVLVRYNGQVTYDRVHSAGEVKAVTSQQNTTGFVQLAAQVKALTTGADSIAMPGGTKLRFMKPLIMGVLNVTPDSFSDGGKFLDPEHALTQARRMIAEGADIIDIGGESTRPGAEPVWEGEEAKRVVPVIEALQEDGVPLSIDTRHSFVMEKALDAGAHIINDVSALTYDPESLGVATKADTPIILMHSQGEPKTMQDNPEYKNTLLDVYDYLAERVDACEKAGIAKERLILDPGIGFGKRMVQDNMALINGLPLLHTLGCPILFGASRKSFIGAVTGAEDAEKRLPGSLAAAIRAVEAGAQIVRVHDVAETKQALMMTQSFKDTAIMDAVPQNS
jgi:dihydropteroate synthase